MKKNAPFLQTASPAVAQSIPSRVLSLLLALVLAVGLLPAIPANVAFAEEPVASEESSEPEGVAEPEKPALAEEEAEPAVDADNGSGEKAGQPESEAPAVEPEMKAQRADEKDPSAKQPEEAAPAEEQKTEEGAANSFRFIDGRLISSAEGATTYDDGMTTYGYEYNPGLGATVYNSFDRFSKGYYTGTDAMRVIDVSEHNGTIDWGAVKSSGLVDYAIIRCGFGQDQYRGDRAPVYSQDDYQWINNVRGCQRYGIPFGVYIYSYAKDTGAAQGEAQHVLNALSRAGLNPSTLALPVFYDLEDSSTRDCDLAAHASVFCSAIQAAGYKAGVYSYLSWWNDELSSPVFDQWYRWVAAWNSTVGLTYEPLRNFAGSQGFWQFTDYGVIPGIPGRTDLSYTYFGSLQASCTVKNTYLDRNTGTFTITVSNIKCTYRGTSVPAQVGTVLIPTWSTEGGQDDIVWYQATNMGNGTYAVTTNITRHKYSLGTYMSHVYVTSSKGDRVYAGATSYNVKVSDPTIKAQLSSDQKSATITGTGGYFALATSVSFPVWSAAGGQDDLVWYQAKKTSAGWSATVNISRHATAGLYYAEAYAVAGGMNHYVGGTTFSVSNPSASIAVTKTDTSGNIVVDVTIKSCPSGVSYVNVPIWFDTGGQDDLVWHRATKVKEGLFRVNTSIRDHKVQIGRFNAHAYVKCGNGVYAGVASTTASVSLGKATVTAAVTPDQKTAWILASGGYFAYASSVSLPVWSKAGGQDDLVWYGAVRTSNGWSAMVNLTRHASAGQFLVDGYSNVGGILRYTGGTTFNVDMPKAKISATKTDSNTGKVTVDVELSGSVAGIAYVDVPLWFDEGGQDDLVWHRARKVSNNLYRVETSASAHRFHTGTFQAHAYARLSNGAYGAIGAGRGRLDLGKPTIQVAVTNDEKTAWIFATGGNFALASSVSFPVWSKAGGQDDLVWYNAVKTPDGWSAMIDISRHATSGLYYVDSYATMGAMNKFSGGSSFSVSSPNATVSVVQSDAKTGRISIEIKLANAPAGVSYIDVPLWFERGGQDDLVWYKAYKTSSGTYRVDTNSKAHLGYSGKFFADAYVKCGNGVYGHVGTAHGNLK